MGRNPRWFRVGKSRGVLRTRPRKTYRRTDSIDLSFVDCLHFVSGDRLGYPVLQRARRNRLTASDYNEIAKVLFGPIRGERGSISTGSRRTRTQSPMVNYGRLAIDLALTFTPGVSQAKVIVPAYYAADAMYRYYYAYSEAAFSEVEEAYLRDQATQTLASAQTEAVWAFSGADKWVPVPYKAPAKQVVNKIMTKVSEKEVDMIERYLEDQAS
jgi:hypothetical protein